MKTNPMTTEQLQQLYALDYECHSFTRSIVIHADCFDWMARAPKESIHAVVTDPPYGVKEYDPDQLEKRDNGNGGVWRIPPSFDGHKRSPLPRFTALDQEERTRIQHYFTDWARLVLPVLRPGGHLFLASNAFLAQIVFTAIVNAGFEFRGQIVRLVQTLRGGDRPKNAEEEFPDVCPLPRGCYEPWGLFRKPIVTAYPPEPAGGCLSWSGQGNRAGTAIYRYVLRTGRPCSRGLGWDHGSLARPRLAFSTACGRVG